MTDTNGQPQTPLFVLKSGAGYILLWESFTAWPQTTNNRKEALRLESAEADLLMLKLERMGVKVRKVKVSG